MAAAALATLAVVVGGSNSSLLWFATAVGYRRMFLVVDACSCLCCFGLLKAWASLHLYISFRMVGVLKVRGHLELQARQKVTRVVHSGLSEQGPRWPYIDPQNI